MTSCVCLRPIVWYILTIMYEIETALELWGNAGELFIFFKNNILNIFLKITIVKEGWIAPYLSLLQTPLGGPITPFFLPIFQCTASKLLSPVVRYNKTYRVINRNAHNSDNSTASPSIIFPIRVLDRAGPTCTFWLESEA